MIIRENDDRLDELEVAMLENCEPVHCLTTHMFTDGMYIREIFMPAGSLITSKIHKTEHPYIVSYGKVAVSIDSEEFCEQFSNEFDFDRTDIEKIIKNFHNFKSEEVSEENNSEE